MFALAEVATACWCCARPAEPCHVLWCRTHAGKRFVPLCVRCNDDPSVDPWRIIADRGGRHPYAELIEHHAIAELIAPKARSESLFERLDGCASVPPPRL